MDTSSERRLALGRDGVEVGTLGLEMVEADRVEATGQGGEGKGEACLDVESADLNTRLGCHGQQQQ